ncbi:MAG: hypothetical protein H6Q58_2168 [Firmicutes bacterium]|nr:hypothetical protein [Bacillota bacterium]
MKSIFCLIKEEEGQGTAEYAILMAGIVVVIIIAINILGIVIRDNMNNSANEISSI